MAERLISEDEQSRTYETTSEGWPDRAGSTRSVRVEYKPGSPGARAEAEESTRLTLEGRADVAFDQLRAYRALASPTQAQTVAAVKVLCGVAITLIRLALRRLDSPD